MDRKGIVLRFGTVIGRSLSIATGLWVAASQLATGQETPSTEIIVPQVGRLFHGTGEKAEDFQPVPRVALQPWPFRGDGSARSLKPVEPPATVTTLVYDPVALVGYEQPVAILPEAPVPNPALPLDWDWVPTADTTVDQELLEQLASSIEQLRANLPAGESEQPAVLEAKSKLEIASQWQATALKQMAKIAERQQETAAAPETQRKLEQEIAVPLPPLPQTLDQQAAIDVHQATLAEHQQNEQRLRTELAAVESRIKDRAKLLAGLGDRRAALKQKLEAARQMIESQVAAENPDKAIIVQNQSIAVASILELRLCDVEQAWCGAMDKIGPLRRDSLKRQLEHAVATTQSLSGLVDELRGMIARRDELKARRAAANAHPLVKDLASGNERLASERTRIAGVIQSDKAEQVELDANLKEVEEVRERLNKHVEAAGHSLAVGIMLRAHRAQLPQTNEHYQHLARIKSNLPDVYLQQLELNEQLEHLPELQRNLHESIDRLRQGGDDPDVSEMECEPPRDGETIASEAVTSGGAKAASRVGLSREAHAELTEMANELLASRRKYLIELNADYETYVTGLSNLQLAHETSIEKIQDLRLFIDQHVLWIRSAQPLGMRDIHKSLAAVRAIGATQQWQDLVRGLRQKLTTNRWPVLLMIGLALVLAVGMRHKLDRRLRDVSRRRSDLRLSPICRSLMLTLLQASFIPVLVATLGWLLSDLYDPESLKASISHGMLLIAPQLFVGSVIYRFCIRGGLAEAQLGWIPRITAIVRRATRRVLRYCLPLMAATYALESYGGGVWSDSLGRLVFIAAMIAFSWATFVLLRGVRRCWKDDPMSAHSVWVQTSVLWSPAMILAPMTLACVAALGYQYSSVFLATRLLTTWWTLLAIVAGYWFASRMLEIGHNIITVRRRWKTPSTGDESSQLDDAPPESETNSVKLQVGRLLHVSSIAAFVIVVIGLWAEVVPAISALDIPIAGPFEQQVTLTNTNEEPETITQLRWITIGDLLMCGVLLAGTFILSRNLPGLLAMIVLDRLPLDRGGKYAISIVCRYLVAAIGIVIASRSIGFSWHSVQWLVAAMGVGLGFGLQEIFANFISGIIILLERPIRAGDLVTVNGTTGIVSKMQLRATTILDYDRRELIVPNKKFITDDVINWTLTDSITRMIVDVGIAYGSDTRLVHDSLMRVARQHPGVLKDPPPQVIFKAFGASSLDFELRVHIPNRDHYPEMQHQLHMAIDEEFRRRKIEIAFPQQDVHLKGLEHLVPSRVVEERDAPGQRAA